MSVSANRHARTTPSIWDGVVAGILGLNIVLGGLAFAQSGPLPAPAFPVEVPAYQSAPVVMWEAPSTTSPPVAPVRVAEQPGLDGPRFPWQGPMGPPVGELPATGPQFGFEAINPGAVQEAGGERLPSRPRNPAPSIEGGGPITPGLGVVPSFGPVESIPAPRQPELDFGRSEFSDSGRATAPRSRAASGRTHAKYVADEIEPDSTLSVQIGRPVLLRFRQPPFRDQVADTAIAEALTIDETQVSISGRTSGTTTINFWFRNPDAPNGEEVLSYLVRVYDDPERSRRLEAVLSALEDEINRAFPNSAVQLSYVGSQVVVRGTAKDINDATQILRIVSRSIPRGNDAEEVPGGAGLFLDGVNTDALDASGGLSGLLGGQTPSGVNSARINSRIVNLLEVSGVHQVMLKVTVAEVNRSAIRAIGAEIAAGGDSVGFLSLLPNVELGLGGPGGNLIINRGDFDLTINALKTLNLARSLAEPNLVTLNGQPANFQVGGQFPVPQITGFTAAGLQGVQFVPFGVQLSFLPIITDRDRVRLNLNASVSTRDEAIGTAIGGGAGGGGSNVPGLNSRTFQTTVELRDGETLAIAGLIQNNYGGTSSRVPFLGDVPVVGRLFSSDQFSYDEQELIVLVTPYLTAPVPAGVCLPVPGSDMFEPSDFEYYVLGRIEGCRREDFRTPTRTDITKAASFRHFEQKYIIGQPGHSDGRVCPR